MGPSSICLRYTVSDEADMACLLAGDVGRRLADVFDRRRVDRVDGRRRFGPDVDELAVGPPDGEARHFAAVTLEDGDFGLGLVEAESRRVRAAGLGDLRPLEVAQREEQARDLGLL